MYGRSHAGVVPMTLAPAVNPTSVISRSTELLFTEVGGDLVLMSIEGASFFGLAGTAKDIWLRLETPVAAVDLCRALSSHYDGDPETIESETLRFLNRMASAGLIAVA
jgi:hypothetical protein